MRNDRIRPVDVLGPIEDTTVGAGRRRKKVHRFFRNYELLATSTGVDEFSLAKRALARFSSEQNAEMILRLTDGLSAPKINRLADGRIVKTNNPSTSGVDRIWGTSVKFVLDTDAEGKRASDGGYWELVYGNLDGPKPDDYSVMRVNASSGTPHCQYLDSSGAISQNPDDAAIAVSDMLPRESRQIRVDIETAIRLA